LGWGLISAGPLGRPGVKIVCKRTGRLGLNRKGEDQCYIRERKTSFIKPKPATELGKRR